MGLSLGGNAFPFDNPGDTVEGEIVEITEMQATDMNTQEPLFWDPAKTRPKMLPTITLATNLRDGDGDNGYRTVHLGGNRYTAVKKATRTLDEGGWLRLSFARWSEREPAQRGFSRAKLFEAAYRPPTRSFNLDTGSSSTAPSMPSPEAYPVANAGAGTYPASVTYASGASYPTPAPSYPAASTPAASGDPAGKAPRHLSEQQREQLRQLGIDPDHL